MKLGFIGFGIMGERLARAALAHSPAIVTVSGVYDPNLATAAKLAAVGSGLTAFDSADALIAASDALHIASPPQSHIDYLRRCHAAGRAVLCEKPLATDIMAAQACVKDMVLGRARAAVNFPFASSLAVDQLIAWISGGAMPNELTSILPISTGRARGSAMPLRGSMAPLKAALPARLRRIFCSYRAGFMDPCVSFQARPRIR
jgi:predicted dehydrogenase